jgi:hypothetical protein
MIVIARPSAPGSLQPSPTQPVVLTPAELGNRSLSNPYNRALRRRSLELNRAARYALTPGCDPTTGEARQTGLQQRARLVHALINASAAGDYPVIPTLTGKKLIYELVLWNLSAQTLILQQGLTGGASTLTLLQLSSFPATTGFTLGFDGNFEQPHFEVDNGQPFILNLGASTQVDGFVRYRVQNGTS